MTKNSPMWDASGLMPSADRPSDSVCSYSSVHDTLSAKTKTYLDKYKQHVLDYAIEWEKVVRTRVDAGLKKAEEMRRELDHYQKKVEALRLSTNQAMAKGKSVKPETTERLKRNEEKLISAKQNYNRMATDLCILMEEIAERSWRDLHPMLVKAAQFDMTLSGDEAKILSGLNQVVSQLKQIATSSGISPQPRLKDLAGLKPELLSTRPGGVSGLTIESGVSPTSSGSFSPTGSGTSPTFGSGPFDPMAQPPGSVAPQGMGGFPVQISEPTPSPANLYSRSSSINSYSSAPASIEPPSTLNMLTISQSAAPAPTLDDVYSANQSSLGVQSAPNSGNYLPPLGPTAPNYRSSSFNEGDSFSAYSQYSAPPMSAPPPPPSMPPPPPPSDYYYQSAYGAPAPGFGAPAGAPPPMSGYPTQQSYTPDASSYSSPWTSNAGNPTNPFGMGQPQPQTTNPFGS